MQRGVFLVGVVFVAACATQDRVADDTSGDAPRIVQQTSWPLRAERPVAQTAAVRRTFGDRSIEGWLESSGTWSIRTEVNHPRLRCATYETGVRVGRGDASCANVEWLTSPQFATQRMHCNGATLIHAGGGTIDLPRGAIERSNCVDVVVRCTGGC